MPTGTFTLVQTFTTIACPEEGCGVTFAITNEYRDRRINDKTNFRCPNGHLMNYGVSDLDRLRKRTEALQRDLVFEQRRLVNERRSHAATKGQLTKTRKRAEHAMCPVQGCRRSFANVARHISNQHPGFVGTTKKT